MTKIYEAAKKYAQEKAGLDVSIKEAYENGMVDMLERVCEWLKTYADDFGVPESESGKVYVDDLVVELRNDMEE